MRASTTRYLWLDRLVTGLWIALLLVGSAASVASGQTGSAGSAWIVTEVGANDFRISSAGADGNQDYDTWESAVAYSPVADQYLIVWESDEPSFGLTKNEFEIVGQRVEAGSGALVGAELRISDVGPDGAPQYDAYDPAIAYNALNNEFLVVWYANDGGSEFEVYGQRLSADGAPLGTNDFRISRVGPDGNAAYEVSDVAVAYNSINNEYLVIWVGDDDVSPLVDDEVEVFGQRLSGNGGALGADDFRISDMGPDGVITASALDPSVVYNPDTNEYLVAWAGDDATAPLVDDEFEVYAQRLDAATGTETGANDFRISTMGPDGNASYDAGALASAYNSRRQEYLVIWRGDDTQGSLAEEELEIFGQRLSSIGAELGADDFRISDMGPDGVIEYDARIPALLYNSLADEYLAAWKGDDGPPLADDEYELYAQRLSGLGEELGDNDFRITDLGPDGNALFQVLNLGLAYNSRSNEYLAVWYGDDNAAPLVEGEYETFGQRLAVRSNVYLPTLAQNYARCWTTGYESEENDTPADANGFLCSGVPVQGWPDDVRDYFRVLASAAGTLTATLTNYTGQPGQLQLMDQAGVVLLAFSSRPPYQLSVAVTPGIYHLRIVTSGGFNQTTPYLLSVTIP